MDESKSNFANELMGVIKQLCKVIFNVTSTEQLEKIFGITEEQFKIVTRKLVKALPEIFFEKSYLRKKEELKTICARELIFFQVQEKWEDPHYQENLANFIRCFSKDIENEF